MKTPRKDGVIVIGGGLAGLVSAILLARQKIPVVVVEKKSYPFHRVCGEYVSNETRPFLSREGLFPEEFAPSEIGELQLTAINGQSVIVPLDMGGFGISRFNFENFLYKQAMASGAQFRLLTEATGVVFREDGFEVKAGNETLTAAVVIGAYGKRSKMDLTLNRSFISRRSPYAAVKYHVEIDFPESRIALHNFDGGYCGIVRVEGGISNVCYLTRSDNLKKYRSVPAMEEAVLFRNRYIRETLERARFVFDRPEVINEISFETKSAIENNILMTGDAAGMIAPLCGNGMAMAIHSATVASKWIGQFIRGDITRTAMESGYQRDWNKLFSRRLWIGRKVQSLFGGENASNFAVNIARYSRPLTRWLVKSTHGEPF